MSHDNSVWTIIKIIRFCNVWVCTVPTWRGIADSLEGKQCGKNYLKNNCILNHNRNIGKKKISQLYYFHKSFSPTCQGIRTRGKKEKNNDLTWKKKKKSCMLQEMHLSDSEHLVVGQVYYSSCAANPRKRSTVILIIKHLPFILENQIRDPEGRFTLITGLIFGHHITVKCLCAKWRLSQIHIQNDFDIQWTLQRTRSLCQRIAWWMKDWTNPRQAL